MKRLNATALIAALATAGVATTAAASIEADVQRIAPQVDLDAATDLERAQITSIVYGGGSLGEKQAQIRALLN